MFGMIGGYIRVKIFVWLIFYETEQCVHVRYKAKPQIIVNYML